MTPQTKINAIETRYAGCRFRSRLEARVAVLFDRLDIAWEYEPQGYLIGPDRDLPYLPDFRLPIEDLWVEVKGSEDGVDRECLLNAAIPHWGLPGGLGMLILGPLPPPGRRHVHSCLTFRKGDVDRSYAEFTPVGISIYDARDLLGPRSGEHRLGNDGGSLAGDCDYLPSLTPALTAAMPLPAPQEPLVEKAYEAARSARFEHGEKP